jgi:Ca-activated chloride channel family protein
MNIVEKVSAFKLGTQALEEALRGDARAATLRLRQAATRLLDMGEAALASEMLRQADVLEHGNSLDPNITKKLRYETRRLTHKLED